MIVITGASDGLGRELAKLIRQMLHLPKNMEITEILVNRKQVK